MKVADEGYETTRSQLKHSTRQVGVNSLCWFMRDLNINDSRSAKL